jgi:hypothetical protein
VHQPIVNQIDKYIDNHGCFSHRSPEPRRCPSKARKSMCTFCGRWKHQSHIDVFAKDSPQDGHFCRNIIWNSQTRTWMYSEARLPYVAAYNRANSSRLQSQHMSSENINLWKLRMKGPGARLHPRHKRKPTVSMLNNSTDYHTNINV